MRFNGTGIEFLHAIKYCTPIKSIDGAYLKNDISAFITLNAINLVHDEPVYNWTVHQINTDTALDRRGYKLITIFGKKYTLHRIVAITFLEKPANATQVIHIDGNKKNNDPSNLEWR